MPESQSLKLIKWYAQHQGKTDEMRKEVGNSFWNYQHTLAEWIMPDEKHNRLAMDNLITGVEAFPCDKCSAHGIEYIKEHKFNVITDDFKEYVWKFHNAINEKLGKPQYRLPDKFASKIEFPPLLVVAPWVARIDDKTIDAEVGYILAEA